MNLIDWLHYLGSLPSGLNNQSLKHIKSIAQKLDVVDFPAKVITVTGTNGKGSTVVFLENILLAAGFKTGAYISPHVLRYTERIRVNGLEVDDVRLCKSFAMVERARGDTVLSYFEFTTLVALLIFKEKNLDVLILEAGLGGRFDAVNVVASSISIITTIALDHTHVLGGTRESIGYEKSGIMRVHKPVICGENMPQTVYDEAARLRAKLHLLHRDFTYIEKENGWDFSFGNKLIKNLPYPRLPITNAVLALVALSLLSIPAEAGIGKIKKSAIIQGLKNSFLMGRYQCLVYADREIILDVAHNPEATLLLSKKLRAIKSEGKNEGEEGRTLAVMSMLRDKNIAESLLPLVSVIDKWYVGPLEGDRAADKFELETALQQAGAKNYGIFPDIICAFNQAIAESQEKDKIIAFGSFRMIERLAFLNVSIEETSV